VRQSLSVPMLAAGAVLFAAVHFAAHKNQCSLFSRFMSWCSPRG
jgi:hypothetical protein